MQNNSRNNAAPIILVVDDEALWLPAGAKVWKLGPGLTFVLLPANTSKNPSLQFAQ